MNKCTMYSEERSSDSEKLIGIVVDIHDNDISDLKYIGLADDKGNIARVEVTVKKESGNES